MAINFFMIFNFESLHSGSQAKPTHNEHEHGLSLRAKYRQY